MENITEILISGATRLGTQLSEESAALFTVYYNFLYEQNQLMNLTSITGKADTARLHFLDSFSPFLTGALKNLSIIDIGSGAGFPGVPLKIADRTIKLTLLDSTSKRITFLSELCAALGLGDVTFIHSRAEEAAHNPALRDSFDIAVSRAVARLNVLCELCLPYVKVGGFFLALKGKESDDERQEALRAIETMGGELTDTINYQIPGLDAARCIYIVTKTSATPAGYPRRYARIQKTPLI